MASCRRENKWNLAQVYLDQGRYLEAMPLLEDIREELPERPDFAVGLAECQMQLGLLAEAQATLEMMTRNYQETPLALWVQSQIDFERGDFQACLNQLIEAEKANPNLPSLHQRIGSTYSRLRQWPDAERAFRRALALDNHSATAAQGLAFSLLRQHRFAEAAEAALQAIGF